MVEGKRKAWISFSKTLDMYSTYTILVQYVYIDTFNGSL